MMHPMAIGEGREAELDGVQGHCPCRGAGQRPALVVAKGHLRRCNKIILPSSEFSDLLC